MDDIILSTQNGEPVASSRDVAKRFGKEHKHVLAAIRQLLVAENSATKFFHETEFEYRGQKFPEYLMNRDGFSLLAMGFTGKEAVQWKLKYIEAFNQMEKQLAQRPQLSRAELMAQALIAAHDELEHKDAQIAELTPKGIFADAVSASKKSILVGELAKLLCQNGVQIGQNRLFSWTHVGHFRPDQNLLMHSVMYRTQVLRDCGMVLPKHTFYVDNIFVYQPLPFVKSMYYMDLDLYRYFIGRADQSVNESVMVKRVDQQLRVTRHMIDCQDLDALKGQKKLRSYMLHYLSMMMAISDIFLLLDGSAAAKQKENELWAYLKAHTSAGVYRSIRYGFGGVTNLKIPKGDKLVLGGYRLAQKIFKFN
mgnify:CR=1 FL=1